MPAAKKKEEVALPSGPLPQALAKILEGVDLGTDEMGGDIPYWISTRCAFLNYILGRPGLPGGHLITFFGKEGGAKSTLTQTAMAEVQSMGGIVLFNDAERRASRDRMIRIGVKMEDLLLLKQRTIEDVFGAAEEAVKRIRASDKHVPILLAIDSLSGLPTGDQVIGESKQPALVAAWCSKHFPILMPWFADLGVTTILVNQTRTHIDMQQGPRSYEVRKVMGQKLSMIAENSLVFWSSLILHMTSTGLVEEDDVPVGIEVRATVKKNSNGPEGKQCEFNSYNVGAIDNVGSEVALLTHLGVFKQVSGWYEMDGLEKKFRREQYPAVLEAHPELKQLIKDAPELWVRGG